MTPNIQSTSAREGARRLRLFLRDYRVLEANISLAEGQNLSGYLTSRKRYLNLTSVQWIGTGEHQVHVALRATQILWASSPDSDIPLTGAAISVEPRNVEIALEGGLTVSAGLPLVQHQRLTDYLEATGGFVPLRSAHLLPRSLDVGEIALNQDAIQLIREIGDRSAAAEQAEETARAG